VKLLKEVEDYIKTKNTLLALCGDKDVSSSQALAKEQEISQKYDDKIRRLEKKKEQLVSEINAETTERIKLIEQQINTLVENLKPTDRKLAILENKDKIEEKTKEVMLDKTLFETRDSSSLIWLEDFAKEKYLHVVLCIAGNDRPKNRFSLVAFGRCAFFPIMEMPRNYSSCSVHISDYKANPWFDYIVHNAPTVEELQEYAKKNRDSILMAFMATYKRTKEEYKNTIEKYTLADFAPLKTIREVSDKEAPVAFKLTKYGKTNTVRIYKNVYYGSLVEKTDASAWEYIKVDGVIFVQLCRIELMEIKQTGNITFGDWWSTSIERGTPNEKTLFNKANYERHLSETEAWLKKSTGKNYDKVNWNPPQIEWIHPELLPSFFG